VADGAVLGTGLAPDAAGLPPDAAGLAPDAAGELSPEAAGLAPGEPDAPGDDVSTLADGLALGGAHWRSGLFRSPDWLQNSSICGMSSSSRSSARFQTTAAYFVFIVSKRAMTGLITPPWMLQMGLAGKFEASALSSSSSCWVQLPGCAQL
jgi:hypothetical protein